MTDISKIEKSVVLTAPEAEFILGALDALVKSQGLNIAASALHVGMKIETAFKEEAVEANDAAPAPKKKASK